MAGIVKKYRAILVFASLLSAIIYVQIRFRFQAQNLTYIHKRKNYLWYL